MCARVKTEEGSWRSDPQLLHTWQHACCEETCLFSSPGSPLTITFVFTPVLTLNLTCGFSPKCRSCYVVKGHILCPICLINRSISNNTFTLLCFYILFIMIYVSLNNWLLQLMVTLTNPRRNFKTLKTNVHRKFEYVCIYIFYCKEIWYSVKTFKHKNTLG